MRLIVLADRSDSGLCVPNDASRGDRRAIAPRSVCLRLESLPRLRATYVPHVAARFAGEYLL